MGCGGPEADDEFGLEGFDFGEEPRTAGSEFAGVVFFVETAFAGGFPFEMFYGVGDVGFGAIDAGCFEGAIEHEAGGTDEGFSGEVFFVAGLFADENDSGVGGTFAEDSLRAGFPKGAGAAFFGGSAKFVEIVGGRRLG